MCQVPLNALSKAKQNPQTGTPEVSGVALVNRSSQLRCVSVGWKGVKSHVETHGLLMGLQNCPHKKKKKQVIVFFDDVFFEDKDL